MPKRIGARIQRNVPALGEVTFGSITMGTIRDAQQCADQVEQKDQAAVFANCVLSRMFVEPKKTAEDVASFPTDTLSYVVNVAIDRLQIRDQFDETGKDLSLQERFYEAFLEHERAWIEELQSSLGRHFDKIAASAQESIQKMSELALKTSISKTQLDYVLRPAKVTESLANNIAQLQSKSLLHMVESVTRVQIPEPYFSDTLIASGLNSPLLHSPTYSLPIVESVAVLEEDQRRTEEAKQRRLVDAYDILSQLEQSLRDVIEANLSEIHGSAWWRRAVPDDVRRECRARKQEKERPLEADHHPIYYAYIDDYKKIIVRRDNWRDTFSSVFESKPELETCFSWIGRVRDSIAHIRPISQDDYLMFVAGARWIQIRITRSGLSEYPSPSRTPPTPLDEQE